MKSRRNKTKKPADGKQYSREEWLRVALEALSKKGESKVQIESICESLGVTKGSFYWHFESRKDFMEALFDYWTLEYSKGVIEIAKAHSGSPEKRILDLFTAVLTEQLGRYDAAIDSWAAHDPKLLAKVKKVYKMRYDCVYSILKELGFSGVNLEVRTVAMISYLKVESQVAGRKSSKRDSKRIKKELSFFTKK